MSAYHLGATRVDSQIQRCRDSLPYHLPVRQPDGTIIVIESPDLATFLQARALIFLNNLADESQALDTMWRMRVRLREAGVGWRLIEAARARLRLGDLSHDEMTWPQRLDWLEAMENLLEHHH